MKRKVLSPIQERIILRIAQGPTHGYALAKECGIKLPHIYMYLRRLEGQGILRSKIETRAPGARGPLPRRMYRLAPGVVVAS